MGDTAPLYPSGLSLLNIIFNLYINGLHQIAVLISQVFLDLLLDDVDSKAWGNRKSVFYGDDVQHDSKKKKKTKKKKTSMLIITSKRNL